MLGLFGTSWEVRDWEGLGCWVSLKLTGEVWGWLGKFETSWGGWRLSRLIWD